MNTRSQFALAALLAFALATVAHSDSAGAQQPTAPVMTLAQPAQLASTRPATAPATSTAPAAQRPYVPPQIAKAIEFSPQEQAILSGIADGTTTLEDDKIMPVMLAHVAEIPALKRPEFSMLENPPARVLRQHPDEFRGLPIRMELLVSQSRQITPGDGMAVSSYWPKDKPVWLLSGLSVNTPDPHSNPLVIISTVDPTEILGTPDGREAQGRVNNYKNSPRRIEVAGLFYRIWRSNSQEAGPMDYPVILAWQINNVAAVSPTAALTGPTGITIGLVLLLAFFYLWWRFRGRVSTTPRPTFLSQIRQQRQQAQRDLDQEPDEFIPVDPALAQAAQQYLKEHPEDQDEHPATPAAPQAKSASDKVSDNAPVDPALAEAARQYLKDHPDEKDRQG